VPIAGGIIFGSGHTRLVFPTSFTLSGIALGTIVPIGAYHLARALATQDLRDRADGAVIAVGTVAVEGRPRGEESEPLYRDEDVDPEHRKP